MTAAMVAKYCAMEEMNGRVNPAMSDSDDESNGQSTNGDPKKPAAPTSTGTSSGTGKNKSSTGKKSKGDNQATSEDENEKKPAVKSVKQYQTKL